MVKDKKIEVMKKMVKAAGKGGPGDTMKKIGSGMKDVAKGAYKGGMDYAKKTDSRIKNEWIGKSDMEKGNFGDKNTTYLTNDPSQRRPVKNYISRAVTDPVAFGVGAVTGAVNTLKNKFKGKGGPGSGTVTDGTEDGQGGPGDSTRISLGNTLSPSRFQNVSTATSGSTAPQTNQRNIVSGAVKNVANKFTNAMSSGMNREANFRSNQDAQNKSDMIGGGGMDSSYKGSKMMSPLQQNHGTPSLGAGDSHTVSSTIKKAIPMAKQAAQPMQKKSGAKNI